MYNRCVIFLICMHNILVGVELWDNFVQPSCPVFVPSCVFVFAQTIGKYDACIPFLRFIIAWLVRRIFWTLSFL